MKNKKLIKGIIFDYGQVICPQDREKINMMMDLTGLKGEDFSRVYFKYRSDYDLGILTDEAYWAKVLNNGRILSPHTIKGLIDIDTKSWLSIDKRMVSFIKNIRNKVSKLAILSNMTSTILKNMKKDFSWLELFDCKIFSCNVGNIKPAREIYEMCLAGIGLNGEECIFIDDSDKNIEGAEKAGINGILYKSFDNLMKILNEEYILTR